MVSDPLVVPGDQSQLHARDEVTHLPALLAHDHREALVVQSVQAVVDVIESGGQARVAVGVRVHRESHQTGGLLAHLRDQAAEPRTEIGAVHAAHRLGDVLHQIA